MPTISPTTPAAPAAPTPPMPPKAPPTPKETSVDDLLRTLQAKGFRDANELRHQLDAIERDLKILDSKKKEIADLEADLEQQRMALEQAKKDMLSTDESRRADIKKQAELYEKNAAIRDALLKAGVAGAGM